MKTGALHMPSVDLDAHETGNAKGDPGKKVILVVSFGTSVATSREAAIGAVEKSIQDAFPDYEMRRAFTSKFIIDKLWKESGLHVDHLTEAMERLVADGVETLICQPTYVINGSEYSDMVSTVKRFDRYFKTLRFGGALLSSTRDYKDVVAAIVKQIPIPDDSALVLMGHGTEHFANAAYAALSYHFMDNGIRNVFVGTVEGYPDLDDILKNLQSLSISKVILAPFMVVAGNHAQNDMSGDDKGSWKSRLKAEGYDVNCVLTGLGEYSAIRDLFVAHVRSAIQRL